VITERLVHRSIAAVLATGAAVFWLAADARRSASASETDDVAVVLAIAPRDHAPERPDAGWCGETAIQQALLYYGAFVPQREINRAGNPRHPDLYWSDIPVALRRLGISYQKWTKPVGVAQFIAWIRGHVRRGRPVFGGVKIYPTDHPRWGLDHFVLVVGYDDDALLMNSTWGHRVRRTDVQLTTAKNGFAFHNRSNRYYGFSIEGLAGEPAQALRVRLSVRRESPTRMDAMAIVQGLEVGQKYRLERSGLGKNKPEWTHAFTASATEQRIAVRVDKKNSAVFRCVPVRD